MEPTSITSPALEIDPQKLTQSRFAPFGTVIEAPSGLSLREFPNPLPTAPNIISANQNTAIKSLDVTHMQDKYNTAPSGVPAQAVMNMFSCFPRALRDALALLPGRQRRTEHLFVVGILERHPFTTQTFIPLSTSSSLEFPTEKPITRYLVIVAPTLPPSSEPPFTVMGPPDLQNLKAFWAHEGQAVTYGVGTWHAPMVVIGEKRVDFVVVQFANGVVEEDCHEVKLEDGEGEEEEGITVLTEFGWTTPMP
ncbi:MAG: hypothetical protein Q9166_004319 [cf. Caloplaca sp. 2 TL-2023]